MRTALLAAGAAAVGLVLGLVLSRWLDRASYRYADEAELPARSSRWVVAAVPVGMALVAAGQIPPRPALGVLLTLFVPVLVALSAIDLDTRRLPDAWVGPSVVVAAVGLGIVSALAGDLDPVVSGVVAGVALGAFYLLNVVVGAFIGSVSAMGLGDAKFAIVLGLLLGPLSWAHVVVATVLAFVTAGVAGLWLVFGRGATRRSHLAFGPHMALGAVLVTATPGAVAVMGGGQ